MKKRTEIAQILRGPQTEGKITVMGWVRSVRNSRFVALNDGSCLATLQVVVNPETMDADTLSRITVGASVCFEGNLVASQGAGQAVELIAETVEIYGDCDPSTYPFQAKNRPSLELLRKNAHLRIRTNIFGAVFRIRHALQFAIHKFYNDKGFFNLHSPIITASDAEGAGEMFHVTTLDVENPPRNEAGEVDYSKDFFERPANLTVSGQLEGELFAMGLSKVYTFGPTFRAENSNTPYHLAEFWMIEPEVAFADLTDNMDLAEEMLKYCTKYALDNCQEDLKFLAERFANEEKEKPQAERQELGLIEKLEFVLANPFERLDYTQAIEILKDSKPYKKGQFKFPVEWGIDLQKEHERYLVEKHFKKPVILINYPKDIKAFYMRQNDEADSSRQTVAAMDVLFPYVGEIIGGSQREERLDKLTQRMQEMHIPEQEMFWFLDTRRFGTCPHAGFGLGFERMMLFITGMTNIRDVIPFPRYPGNAEF
jgi:asparaginyl-tRNA synthetase